MHMYVKTELKKLEKKKMKENLGWWTHVTPDFFAHSFASIITICD